MLDVVFGGKLNSVFVVVFKYLFLECGKVL